ncbi:MAG: hypothetical protein CMP95_05840 [Gammaproteobacteria bacterium]|uniref:Thiol:disulfide interchange protein n=1 Tax=OM182 bacterium TaxID=2510334 RepID=A0A520S2F6_9GAMM|nr:hypothetical protein [Gammaproteobacteria bacterium]OUV68253.1 MAG: hypothetical protein CBC93_02690 [Gammaproteobacteria bacterium TMED133]RZO76660.1 MAG: thiol:disulfide interchange protein DsbA/DsbL [OM182 bacterium]
MAKANSKFLKQQKVFVGLLLTGIVILLVYLSVIVAQDVPLGEFVPGKHYIELEENYRVRGNKIEVVEFFSYACIVCYHFDPLITDWAKENENIVEFRLSPLPANETWRRLAQHYYTLERLDVLEEHHKKFFFAVHEKNLNISSPARVAEWAKEQSIIGYKEAASSLYVKRRLAAADQLARSLKIASVPTLLVNGKYVITITDKVGSVRMLEILDYLVEKELILSSVAQ